MLIVYTNTKSIACSWFLRKYKSIKIMNVWWFLVCSGTVHVKNRKSIYVWEVIAEHGIYVVVKST